MSEAVHVIAGQGDDVGLPLGAQVQGAGEETLRWRAAEMQIAQVQDRQAVPLRRQTRQGERLAVQFDLQRLVQRESREETPLAVALDGTAEVDPRCFLSLQGRTAA